MDRRVDLVRQAAAELLGLSGEPANLYWRTLAADLLRDMIGQGIDMEVARAEVLRFFEAVQAEFQRELAIQREMMPA
jgi:hypothetical protein